MKRDPIRSKTNDRHITEEMGTFRTSASMYLVDSQPDLAGQIRASIDGENDMFRDETYLLQSQRIAYVDNSVSNQAEHIKL